MPVLRVICLIFSRGGWFCPPPLGGFWGMVFEKKNSDSHSEFHIFFLIHCTFLYKILGLRQFWSCPLCFEAVCSTYVACMWCIRTELSYHGPPKEELILMLSFRMLNIQTLPSSLQMLSFSLVVVMWSDRMVSVHVFPIPKNPDFNL